MEEEICDAFRVHLKNGGTEQQLWGVSPVHLSVFFFFFGVFWLQFLNTLLIV